MVGERPHFSDYLSDSWEIVCDENQNALQTSSDEVLKDITQECSLFSLPSTIQKSQDRLASSHVYPKGSEDTDVSNLAFFIPHLGVVGVYED
jgi:hypothetical protein